MTGVVLLTLTTAGDDLIALETLIAGCWAHGCLGIEQRDDRIVATFPDPRTAETAASSLAHRVIGPPQPVSDPLAGWEAPNPEIAVGGLLIRPIGHEGATTPVTDGRLTPLFLSPGRAFGSGTHPSTRLALGLLQELELNDRRVLDAGTGTGVLAVAAALLGAGSVRAVDVDSDAVEAARGNVAANSVDEVVCVEHESIDRLGGDYDVVIMNVTIDTHEILAPAVHRLLGESGELVATGVLEHSQRSRLEALHSRFEVVDRLTEGPWAALRLRLPRCGAST